MEHEMRSLWSQMLRRWQSAGLDEAEARLRDDAGLPQAAIPPLPLSPLVAAHLH